MPDLLAHVFLSYGICLVLSWRWGWIDDRYITLGMVGSFVPDIGKVSLLLPDPFVERALGVPFSWNSFTTGGGVFVSLLIGVVLLASDQRRRGGAMLAVGAVVHLAADGLLLSPTGRTLPLFWPLAQYRLPSPGLYLSTQIEPTLVAGALAVAAWALDTYHFQGQ